jgi:hypothetical protein
MSEATSGDGLEDGRNIAETELKADFIFSH